MFLLLKSSAGFRVWVLGVAGTYGTPQAEACAT
jgi:hypothetical protein